MPFKVFSARIREEDAEDLKYIRIENNLDGNKEILIFLKDFYLQRKKLTPAEEVNPLIPLEGDRERMCDFGSLQKLKDKLWVYCDNTKKTNLTRNKMLPLNSCNRCFELNVPKGSRLARFEEERKPLPSYLTKSQVKKLSNAEYEEYAKFRNQLRNLRR